MLRSSYKYLEQLIFSSIPFVVILASGWLMQEDEFFVFSYAFSVLQGALVLLFSFESNPILVFYRKYISRTHDYMAYKLLSCMLSSTLMALACWAFLATKFEPFNQGLYGMLLWASLVSWLLFDACRKYLFAKEAYPSLFAYSAVLSVAFLLLNLVWLGITGVSTISVFSSIALAFGTMVVVLMVRQSLACGWRESSPQFLRENLHFAKWSVAASMGMWLMGQGLLLVTQPWLSVNEFNGLRIMLTFVGLANIVTTVIENKLVVKFSQTAQTRHMMHKELVQISLVSLGLIMLVAVATAIAFALFYSSYAAVLEKSWWLLASVFCFSVNKPLIAKLKVLEQTRSIFIGIVAALIATALALTLTGFIGSFYAIIAAFVLGPATLFVCCLLFVERALREDTV